MNMTNVTPNVREPNVMYIPPACIGSCVGLIGTRIGSSRVFRYQHVGIGNGKLLRGGAKPTLGSSGRAFASQWNIG